LKATPEYVPDEYLLHPGMCCTIFVPETKRIDLDEAALHSKSIFGHFMDRCGVHQVTKDSHMHHHSHVHSATCVRYPSW